MSFLFKITQYNTNKVNINKKLQLDFYSHLYRVKLVQPYNL